MVTQSRFLKRMFGESALNLATVHGGGIPLEEFERQLGELRQSRFARQVLEREVRPTMAMSAPSPVGPTTKVIEPENDLSESVPTVTAAVPIEPEPTTPSDLEADANLVVDVADTMESTPTPDSKPAPTRPRTKSEPLFVSMVLAEPHSVEMSNPNLAETGPPPSGIAAEFAPGMDEVFDHVWVKIPRRLSAPAEEDAIATESMQLRNRSVQSIVVTSWAEDEGTSTVALGLAMRAAFNSQQEICLVDADFHGRDLTNAVAMNHRPGLHEVINGDSKLENVLVPVGDSRLWFLPAGRSPGGESLAVDRKIQQVVANLEERFRYVFYDTSCLKRGVEAYRWGRFVINSILVVLAGGTRRQTVAHAVSTMRLQGMDVIGTILNRRIDPIPNWLYKHM